MTAIIERQRARFIHTESKNSCETFLHTKSFIIFKNLDNFCYVFIYKKNTLDVTVFFKIFLKLVFLYKKHDTLRYVKFLYTKIQTLCKNLRYVFIYKKLDTLRYVIFHGIFEIGGGGGHFYILKTMHFVLHFYMQKKLHFALSFYIQKAL